VTSLRAGAASDVGRVRSVNQDCFLVQDGLWAVADGMGGHAAGDVAARVAVDTLQGSYRPGADGDALVDAIRQANQAVWQRARSDSALRGMGTTLTAVAAAPESDGDERLIVANVGDSRAYLFESGELSQLTADHSLVEEMVRAGELSPHEAAGHPQRHIVTRALGIEPDIEVDTWIITPHAGDRFVVCSDGLSNEVADRDLARVLGEEPDAQAAADRLV
jgi:PPM family protein phosphatase